MVNVRQVAPFVAVWLAAACGDAGVTDYYQPEGDDYIGGSGPGQEQPLPEQPTGDPCAADSPWTCHPVTGEGCEGEDLGCDFGFDGSIWGFFCFTDCTEPLGASCDQVGGPWCASGMTCRDGSCELFCCEPADCPEGTACQSADWNPPLESGPGFCLQPS